MSLGLAHAGHAYEPQVNYQLHCMGCHLADGSGEADRVPSVRATLVPFSMFANGRDYVLRVPGVAQSPLDDADVAAVLNWMARNLSDTPVPTGFRDYDAREVQTVRARPLVQVKALRRELIERMGRCSAPGNC
jgi:hypothetical protein